MQGAAAASVCPAGCTCQPKGELVSCVGLTTVPRFIGHSPKVLKIAQHRITKVSSNSFKGLERLEELEITEGRLFEISHDAFSSLRHLKYVNLSNNELAVLPRDSFAGCVQLKQLDLSWNPLVLPGRGPLLVSKSLSAMDLSSCSLSEVPDQVFSMVPALSELRLRGNRLQQVSKCVLDPLEQLILLDVERTVEWVRCSSQEATTSGVLHTLGGVDSGGGQIAPTNRILTFAPVAFGLSLEQWIFLTIAALVVVLLLACIRKVCKPEERRKGHMYEILGCNQAAHLPIKVCKPEERRNEHTYEIIGGNQAAYLPINPYTDFRISRISTNTSETYSDSARVSMADGESRQYLPNYLPPVPARQS